MNRILVIDKGNSSVRQFQSKLKTKRFSVLNAQGIKDAISSLRDHAIDIIVVDPAVISGSSHLGMFTKAAQNIPKIVLTREFTRATLGSWLNDELAVTVREPVVLQEFLYHVNRLTRHKKVIEEKNELYNAFTSKKREILFFEDITGILTSSLNLHKVLAEIMKRTKAMIGAEAWSILLFDEDKKELHFERTQSRLTEKIKKFRLKVGEGIPGWVAMKGEPVVVADASRDKRFSRRTDRLLNLKTRSLMCIPIKIKSEIIGVLEITNKQSGEPFTKEDLDLPLKLVNHAAMAIERASLYRKMEELSLKDDVTNLFNTRYLNRAIEIEIERSDRYGPPFTLIFMDIDFFKKVNDQHGHIVGGKVLVEVAQLLLNNLRTLDIVARYGGDEFVIVLPQTTSKYGFLIAERLRKSMERKEFLKSEGYVIKITASFGVASYPEHAKSKEDLFRIADEAMYRGKFSTKNIVYAAASS